MLGRGTRGWQLEPRSICSARRISLAEFQQMSEDHRLPCQSLPYKKTYALSLDTVRELPAPVGFHKKWGAIGWSEVRCSRAELPPACKKASKALKPRRAGRRSSARAAAGGSAKQAATGHARRGLTNVGNSCYIITPCCKPCSTSLLLWLCLKAMSVQGVQSGARVACCAGPTPRD